MHLHEQFSKDLKLLKLKTNSAKFKFPTTLAKYKKDLNPVAALYNYTQEVLITYNKKDIKHTWLLALFDNTEWAESLINSICDDIKTLSSMCMKYINSASDYIQKKIKEMARLIEKYGTFLEVFSSIQDWKKFNK